MTPKPIKLETGIPMPEGRKLATSQQAMIRDALERMKPGGDRPFKWKDNRAPYKVAKSISMKIKTRKVNGEGYRVWRVS